MGTVFLYFLAYLIMFRYWAIPLSFHFFLIPCFSGIFIIILQLLLHWLTPSNFFLWKGYDPYRQYICRGSSTGISFLYKTGCTYLTMVGRPSGQGSNPRWVSNNTSTEGTARSPGITETYYGTGTYQKWLWQDCNLNQLYMKLVYTTNTMRMRILPSPLVRQVDNYLVANKDYMECERIGEMIQARMTNPLDQLRVIWSSKLIYKQTNK